MAGFIIRPQKLTISRAISCGRFIPAVISLLTWKGLGLASCQGRQACITIPSAILPIQAIYF